MAEAGKRVDGRLEITARRLFDDKQTPPAPPPEPAPEEDDEKIEDVGPCACVSRATNKWWRGIHVKRAQQKSQDEHDNGIVTRSFDYSHMGYRRYGQDNTWFVIEFNEPEKWKMTVKGRDLWTIYNYIHQHRIDWIAPADRGFNPENGPFIESIVIERIEQKEEKKD